MNLRRLLRTYNFRNTLLFVALVGVAVSIVFGVIYWTTSRFMESQLRSAIKTEMSWLVEDFDVAGSDAIAEVIARRIGVREGRSGYYLLQDATGRRVAGNLPTMDPVAGWHELPIPDDEDGPESTDSLLARGESLSNGWFVAVAKDMDEFTDFEEMILEVAGWSLAAAFGLALLGGLAASAGMLRRVEAISDAGRDIMKGNLSRRIALRGSDDEFDRLSGNLNEMLDRIQMLMQNIRQVSNDIAHDLRTPLTRLRQRLEGARAKARTAAEYQKVVDSAIAETDEILDTFGALLRIAEIEAGARRAAFTDVDLSDVLHTIVETYAVVADDLRHCLRSRIANGVAVRGDRQLLTQMIANLVENALRHTPAESAIEIDLDDAPAGLVLAIADNGPGIPETERQRVFRRFYRLDSSRATPGNGLGLSLVAAVAELHRIAVEIDDNRPGLRVTLRFPPPSEI